MTQAGFWSEHVTHTAGLSFADTWFAWPIAVLWLIFGRGGRR